MLTIAFVQVRYEVQYNYAELNASASANPDADDLIRNTIGNITYVAEGFSNNTEFSSLYEIDTSKDNDFTGKADVFGGCEATLGLSVYEAPCVSDMAWYRAQFTDPSCLLHCWNGSSAQGGC